MKILNLKKNLVLSLMIMLFACSAFAQREGGSGSHGGDPRLMTEAKLKLFIQKQLKMELIDTLFWIQDHYVSDDEFKNTVLILIDRGLADDVVESPFRFENQCVDYRGKLKGATALLNKPRSSVCWSPDFLLNRNTKEDSLVGLGFHEFIHHYGFKDADHILAAKFEQLHLQRLAEKKRNPPKPRPQPNYLDVSEMARQNRL